jgi:hypothetical protein
MTDLNKIHQELLDTQQKLAHEFARDTPRNRNIRRRRVHGETLTSIGEDYGITRERVRQICANVPHIRKIRNAIDKRILPLIKRERVGYDAVESFNANYTRGDEDDCWNWEGCTHPVTGYGVSVKGYGTAFVGIGRYTHRRAWYLANKGALTIGKSALVMHTCDNPTCVNPAHLILGNPKMNHYDAVIKGRKTPGFQKKLSLKDVKEIIKNYHKASDCAVLAKKHGVSAQYIYNIAKGRARS